MIVHNDSVASIGPGRKTNYPRPLKTRTDIKGGIGHHTQEPNKGSGEERERKRYDPGKGQNSFLCLIAFASVGRRFCGGVYGSKYFRFLSLVAGVFDSVLAYFF